MKRAIVTVGLGWGDEGKGATCDYLCRELDVDLVVRYSGGSQCGHNVELPDGRRHTFSQFGAGTLAGVSTHLGPQVIINPIALLREALHLQTLNINKPFDTLTVDPNCLVSTVYHQAVNQAKEIARGEDRHGSCGHGIGETRSYWLKHGSEAITAIDLVDKYRLREKVELLRQRMMASVGEIGHKLNGQKLLLEKVRPEEVCRQLMDVGKLISITHHPVCRKDCLFEGAQGVLLDEWYGTFPFVTHSTVTPYHSYDLMYDLGVNEFSLLGVTRTYSTRHGAGPFPTYDKELTERLPDPGNPRNQWQEGFRCGVLDLVLLKYAVKVCGGVDGLVVNHLDQSNGLGVLTEYRGYAGDPDIGGLLKMLENPSPNYGLYNRFSEELFRLQSYTWGMTHLVPHGGDDFGDFVLNHLREVAPVVISGRGPTSSNRSLDSKALQFRPLPVL